MDDWFQQLLWTSADLGNHLLLQMVDGLAGATPLAVLEHVVQDLRHLRELAPIQLLAMEVHPVLLTMPQLSPQSMEMKLRQSTHRALYLLAQ